MNAKEKIEKLSGFRNILGHYEQFSGSGMSGVINSSLSWVRQEVIDAGLFTKITLIIPATSSSAAETIPDIDPFLQLFDFEWNSDLSKSVLNAVKNAVERTFGHLEQQLAEEKANMAAAKLISAADNNRVSSQFDPFRVITQEVNNSDLFIEIFNGIGLNFELELAEKDDYLSKTRIRALLPRVMAAYESLTQEARLIAANAALARLMSNWKNMDNTYSPVEGALSQFEQCSTKVITSLRKIGWDYQGIRHGNPI